jgi:hypothetical protein
LPAGERAVGEESKAALGAERDGAVLLCRACEDAQLVLDAHDLGDPHRHLDLRPGHVREAEEADLASSPELSERAYRLFERDARVGGMVLIEIDPIAPERAQALFTGRAQARGPCVDNPAPPGRETPPFVATRTSSRRPASAMAISRSLWPRSLSSSA